MWRLEWHVTDCLMLSSGFWAVLMAMDDMPGKALGLLAEWMRHLPLMNEAYLLQHKQEPEELNVQHEDMRTLLDKEEDGAFCVDVKLTPFWVGEKRAAQRHDNRRMVFFTSELIELASAFPQTGAVQQDGGLARWYHPEKGIRVWLAARRDVEPERAAVLERYDCWGGGGHGGTVAGGT